jgi:hypothetical protein
MNGLRRSAVAGTVFLSSLAGCAVPALTLEYLENRQHQYEGQRITLLGIFRDESLCPMDLRSTGHCLEISNWAEEPDHSGPNARYKDSQLLIEAVFDPSARNLEQVAECGRGHPHCFGELRDARLLRVLGKDMKSKR